MCRCLNIRCLAHCLQCGPQGLRVPNIRFYINGGKVMTPDNDDVTDGLAEAAMNPSLAKQMPKKSVIVAT